MLHNYSIYAEHCATFLLFSLSIYYRREDEIRRRMKRPETTSSTMASSNSEDRDGSSKNQFPPFSIILEESSSTSNFSSRPIHHFNFSVLWLTMIVMFFWSFEIYYIWISVFNNASIYIYLHSGLKSEKRGNLGKRSRNAISSKAKFNRGFKIFFL